MKSSKWCVVEKPKIVLDTNVFISAMIGKSYPFLIIVELVQTGIVQICVSEITLSELVKVSNYPKFLKIAPKMPERTIELIENLKNIAFMVDPKIRIDYIKDEADNRFLELAIAAKATYLITGNTKDFDFNMFEGIKIMSPKDFYERFSPHQ